MVPLRNERVQPMTTKLGDFTNAYIEAALWAECDDDGVPFDNRYEIAPGTLAAMIADCERFQRENSVDLYIYDHGDASAGHDFWLTRNGHGAGFWHRGDDAVYERLTEAAHAYGEVCLYVGDDGLIHGAWTMSHQATP